MPLGLAQYGIAFFAIGGFIWLLAKILVPRQPNLTKIIEDNTAAFRDHAAASRDNAATQKELIEVIRQYGSVMEKYEGSLDRFADIIQKQSDCMTELRVEIARREKVN